MISKKSFYFKLHRGDFRSGPFVDCQDENTYNCSELDLFLPTKKYFSYIIKENSCYENVIVVSKEFDEKDDAEKFLLETYSLVNKMTPFVITGMTAGYKETGYYGDPIPITFLELKNLNKNTFDYNDIIYGVVISKNGDVVKTLAIRPAE